MNPRLSAEESFAKAAAGAALFELRFRMLIGSLEPVAEEKLDQKLSKVCDDVANHFGMQSEDDDYRLLTNAIQVRNKLLHCDFSKQRKKLDERNPKSRDGQVIRAKVDMAQDNEDFIEFFKKLVAGENVGQESISSTTTKKRNAVYGWLMECWQAGEFDEACETFEEAILVLESLSTKNNTTDS